MKFYFLALTCFFIFACSNNTGNTNDPHTVNVQGGVDVGNMSSSSAIPMTHATVTYPNTWKATLLEKSLILTNAGSSTIQARRSDIINLVAPTQIALQNYLKTKYPDRNYEMIEINGLKGVRAELKNSAKEKESDIYLVSELKDFVHITSKLNNLSNGFTEGEDIISTVRLKYKGVAVKGSSIKTFEIGIGFNGYSFSGQCYTNFAQLGDCFGFDIKGNSQYLWVNDGRIIEIGSAKDIAFDSIRIDGEYLLAPQSKTAIQEIYSAFTPKDQSADQNSIKVKQDYIYLIRAVNWPYEDLIIKMQTGSLTNNTLTVTYQVLVSVEPEVLKNQVNIINKNTIENEMPLAEGEVTLYNHDNSNNKYYASFNFQYSNSGNNFIVQNSWDFTFNKACDGPTFQGTNEILAVGDVITFDFKSLSSIQKSDFPDPNLYDETKCGVIVEVGKTYGVYHHENGPNARSVFGAIHVLDMDKDGKWVRLKFRRISVSKPEKFQKWIPTPSPPDQIQKLETPTPVTALNRVNQLNPYVLNLEDDLISFKTMNGLDSLSIDNLIYPQENGFFNFGKTVDINSITLNDITNKKGQFSNKVNFNEGDVIGIYIETYLEKVILVVKIQEHNVGKSVTLSTKYLDHAEVHYGKQQ
ncbi:hypothetical protein [Pseudobdellovibrio sp. HCB154]|uniref:hypothetical protein n=1 Tax=Pseudobdellovibrio sp. HCB154 TaxID=3386277 RepID=UPI00391738AE